MQHEQKGCKSLSGLGARWWLCHFLFLLPVFCLDDSRMILRPQYGRGATRQKGLVHRTTIGQDAIQESQGPGAGQASHFVGVRNKHTRMQMVRVCKRHGEHGGITHLSHPSFSLKNNQLLSQSSFLTTPTLLFKLFAGVLCKPQTPRKKTRHNKTQIQTAALAVLGHRGRGLAGAAVSLSRQRRWTFGTQ